MSVWSICGMSVLCICGVCVWSIYGMSVWSICGICLTYKMKRPSVCVVYMWYVLDLQEEEAQCLCGLYVVCLCCLYVVCVCGLYVVCVCGLYVVCA